MSAAHSADERRRKLLIRSMLVSGTTVATLMSAQSLTWIDAARVAATAVPEAAITPLTASNRTVESAPALAVQHSAPNLVILRRPGTPPPNNTQAQSAAPAASGSASVGAIQPPVPVIAQPQPIIVNPPLSVQPSAANVISAPNPVVANSHSSR